MVFDVAEVLEKASNSQKFQLLSGQDFWHTATLEDLRVPPIRLSDGPNGIRGSRYFPGVPAACIPCETALGATWDKSLLQRAGELLGHESIAKGAHCWLGPTINIQRSPLGGRGFESFSEDPHLSGILASYIIRGCESTGVQATSKHFVCNDQEHERRAVDTLVTERALREVYLRPFQIVARDCPSGCLMTCYNKVNGKHVSQDIRLLQGVVREEWGWDPLVVSDWYGTYSTVEPINAGLDLEMPGKTRWRGAYGDFAFSSRLIKQSTLDTRAKRVLEFVKRASQLKVAAVEGKRDTKEDRILNRSLCAQSIVLLKNDKKILPLPPKIKRVALIGSHMKLPAVTGGGSASLQPYYVVSPYDAITTRLAGTGTEVVYEVGGIAHKMLPIMDSNMLRLPNGSGPGVSIKFFNEPASAPNRICVAEEQASQIYFQLMDYHQNPKLNYDLFYARGETIFVPDETGIWEIGVTCCGTCDVYLDGELLVDNSTTQRPGSSFFGKGTAEEIGTKQLVAGQEYKVAFEFGSSATSKVKHLGAVSFGGGGARLGASLRIDPQEAVMNAAAAAAGADYAILCTGLNGDWESEGYDRPDMSLPPGVDDLISAVLTANPNTIVVTQSGTPFSMPWFPKVTTLLQSWYGGNEIGNAIADVLFGEVNPSAKLPLSWPIRLQDNPSYLNFGATQGRVLYGEDVFVGYKYYDKLGTDVLFPFGHGLSYTTFELSNLSVEGPKVTLDVRNAGEREGAEVVQVYIAATQSKINRPVRELHGFEKVVLQPGQLKRVSIEIDKYAGALWDEAEDKWLTEKGEYEVLVGTSSRDLLLKGVMTVEKSRHWLGL